jgi:hypothetical protein
MESSRLRRPERTPRAICSRSVCRPLPTAGLCREDLTDTLLAHPDARLAAAMSKLIEHVDVAESMPRGPWARAATPRTRNAGLRLPEGWLLFHRTLSERAASSSTV